MKSKGFRHERGRRGGGEGNATRDLVTTVNFTLGKKSRGRVVRPISRGLLSNKLVSERMAMAAAASAGRRGTGERRREAKMRGGRAAGMPRTQVAGARGISCQMILIGSCRAIQRRPKKTKKKIERWRKTSAKKRKTKKKRERDKAHMRVARNKTRFEYIDLSPSSPSNPPFRLSPPHRGHRRWDTRLDLLKIADGTTPARRFVNNEGGKGEAEDQGARAVIERQGEGGGMPAFICGIFVARYARARRRNDNIMFHLSRAARNDVSTFN